MTLHALEVPASAPATALVVWLHGLGASGDDFVPVVPMMALPEVHWVFPNAPRQPVTLNGGYVMPSWYDIRTLAPGPQRENIEQLRASAAAVDALVDERLSALGLGWDRVVIAGFSQGGAVAMELLTQGTRKVLGGVVLSSYWATPEQSPSVINATTPMWFGHGQHDDVVPAARGREAYEALVRSGRPASWSDYPMAHEVCMPQLEDLRTVLQGWIR